MKLFKLSLYLLLFSFACNEKINLDQQAYEEFLVNEGYTQIRFTSYEKIVEKYGSFESFKEFYNERQDFSKRNRSFSELLRKNATQNELIASDSLMYEMRIKPFGSYNIFKANYDLREKNHQKYMMFWENFENDNTVLLKELSPKIYDLIIEEWGSMQSYRAHLEENRKSRR
ncbi:hypothetical protein [Sediminitomix flava]|uniref:Uncharacterized protein n=1 Tax=Sediminitomix flava TaxID=379075 RepID=A0A315ZEH1_SEDFL|nr:hypothetical protein [Sediminitomix flava]PWJ43218.1 hypothetical protein BC781_102767 [Sediminitomix flava]